MLNSKVTIFILLLAICSAIPHGIFAQNDSALVNSESQLQQLNDSSYLFKKDSIVELWLRDKSLDIWKLNDFTEILTYDNNGLRIWRQGNNVGLWFYAPDIGDWRMYATKELNKKSVNDSVEFALIDDTTKLVYINEKPMVVNFTSNIFSWNSKLTTNNIHLTDSIDIQSVNDTTNLWVRNDSVVLWYLNTNPKIWALSTSTIVWSIDFLTEFWKAGENYKLWRRKNLNDQWALDEKTNPIVQNEAENIWPINDSIMIFASKDSVQIWQANRQKKIWKMGDSILIWTITIPAIDTAKTDTIREPIRVVKKAALWDVDNSIKLWSVNDTTKLFTNEKGIELWKINKKAKLWKLSDSTLIWNIDEKTKLSLISDSLTVWLKNDSTFEWDVDSTIKPQRISDNIVIVEINDSLRYTKLKDTSAIWHSSSAAKIASRNSIKNFLILNDTTELWEPNDSTKLWIDKFASDGNIWEKNKRVNILNINDSTKIWQVNEEVRLSIINGKLKIWQQGTGDPYLSWKESRGFRREEIDDSIKIWHINNGTIIWETPHKIEVWNKNKKLELHRLNDTSLVWTFSTALVPEKIPKPKYWTILGSGKMDIAQVWVDQWVKGGENSLSTLFIINFQANYKKKKIRWDNDFEYRYGFLRTGDAPLRKNEDKFKVNSVFNYYAVKKWYYSFTNTLQSQFFKGYKYESDTSYVVSDRAAPLYYTAALGMNYFPLKQLSVFFSPFTNKLTYVRDTVLVDQTSYGVPHGKKMKNEPGAIIKSILNWDITHNINLLSKLDLFTRYDDLEKYNLDWEVTLTFKFNNFVNATFNTHLLYDPDVSIEDKNGNMINPFQFKEVLSIGLFYKI